MFAKQGLKRRGSVNVRGSQEEKGEAVKRKGGTAPKKVNSVTYQH